MTVVWLWASSPFWLHQKGQRFLWVYNFFVDESVLLKASGIMLIEAVENTANQKAAWMQLNVLGNT